MPIKRTAAEIVAEGPALLGRLDRALTAVERSQIGAGADLATVLRILLDANNPGNRAMARLATALKVDLPSVLVSGGPATEATRGLVLSFGNLPLTPSPGDSQPYTPRWLPFNAWLDVPSIVAPLSEKRRLSWRQFATLIANTGGAHLGTEYHDLLITSDRFSAAGMTLQDYLLRQVGWQVERVLADSLARTGHPLLPRTRRIDFLPRTPVWMEFRDEVGIGVEMSVGVSVTSDVVHEVEVMRFTRRGRIHRLFHNGGAPSNGLQVRLVIDDLETGQSSDIAGEPSARRTGA